MKKFYLFLAVCFISIGYIHANQVENFWLDYSDMLINKEQAIQILYDSYDMPEGSTLLCTREVKDNTDMKHYTIQQYVNDIKVEGCYVLIHEKEGKVYSMNGRLLNVENTPQLQKVQNKKQIKAKLPDIDENDIEYLLFEHNGQFYFAYKYFDQNRYANVYVDSKSGEEIVAISTISSADVQGTAKTIYNGTQTITCNYTDGIYTLVDNARNIYTLNATQYDGENFNSLYHWVSATTSWNKPILSSITLEWASQDWWYNALTDTKPDFYIQISSGGNILYKSDYLNDTYFPITFLIPPTIVEADGNLKVEVLDYDGVLDDSAGKVSITNTNAGTYSWNNSKTRASFTLINNPAHDAHWGMEKVYDFYHHKFNHLSYDGKGSQIIQMINPPSSICSANNAKARWGKGSYDMVYGLGDYRYDYQPFVVLDIMGHEFTHLVTAANGDQNLPITGEGGALNESFGDIMGNAIESYALGTADWEVAKGIFYSDKNKSFRSLKNPKRDGCANTYKGDKWQPITGKPNPDSPAEGGNDNDWVHYNCGVQNYWFYLLCQGGSGYIDDNAANGKYSVKGIGMDKAIQIVYKNLLYYITSTSQYPDSREGSIEAAIYLYGKGSPEHKAVVNAWHAVGVGDKYVEEPTTSSDQFLVLAQRKTGGNWFYMTADLGTAGTKRFQAIDAGTSVKEDINRTPDGEKYLWSFEDVAGGVALKNGTQYATWNAGNSAILSSTPKAFSIVDAGEDIVNISFVDGDGNTRYLSLNATEGNNYFAFYKGTTQKYNLLIIPYGEQQPPIEEPKEEFVVLAQRNNTSNWFYMTADLGTAGTKRFQAVDAGTPNKSMINTSPIDSKYIWSFEEVAGGIALVNEKQYASWKSGNSAILSTTPMALNITDISDDQVNMSFVDNEGNTRYLSLNATEGNNYFAFYKGTTQKCNLLVIPYGEKITTELEAITLTETPIVQKIMRDGQLLILRDGKTYNVMGQEL